VSARKVYRLDCDHADCRARFTGVEKLDGTRRAAANAGWSHVLRTKRQGIAPSLDFCQAHAAEASKPWCPRCSSADVEVDEISAGKCHGCGEIFLWPHRRVA
jgi:hypothetical protein